MSTDLNFSIENIHDGLAYVAHNSIDLLHKSHNALVPFPTMPHFDISVTKWCLVGYLFDALSYLWNGSIVMTSAQHSITIHVKIKSEDGDRI